MDLPDAADPTLQTDRAVAPYRSAARRRGWALNVNPNWLRVSGSGLPAAKRGLERVQADASAVKRMRRRLGCCAMFVADDDARVDIGAERHSGGVAES